MFFHESLHVTFEAKEDKLKAVVVVGNESFPSAMLSMVRTLVKSAGGYAL